MERTGRQQVWEQAVYSLSIENRQFYETEGEKRQSFQLDTDAILKEAVIKLFIEKFKVFATLLVNMAKPKC